jgi:hypothetical protein
MRRRFALTGLVRVLPQPICLEKRAEPSSVADVLGLGKDLVDPLPEMF